MLCRRRSDSEQHVIKEVKVRAMGRKEREDARKEVKVLAKMRHPNIVSCVAPRTGPACCCAA